jgi:hypothetical protein
VALSTATISYNLADMVGADFDPTQAQVWVTTNVPGGAIADTVGNAVRLGDGVGSLAADGTGSLSVWVPGAGSNPASWQTTIHVSYSPRRDGWRPVQRDFGPFTITANADLADLVAEQEVPPTYLAGVVTQLQAMIDQGLKGPTGPAGPAGPAGANGGSDASTADNLANGTATKAALAAVTGVGVPAVNPITKMLHADAFGAVGDGKILKTVTTTAGSPIVTKTGAGFTSNAVGKAVSIYTPTGRAYLGTIASVQSATQVTLAGNATITGSVGVMSWGTDNTAALNAWANATTSDGGEMYLPTGLHVTTGPINIAGTKSYYTMRGANNGLRAPQFGAGRGSTILQIDGTKNGIVVGANGDITTRPSGITFTEFGIYCPAKDGGRPFVANQTDHMVLRGVTMSGFGTGFYQSGGDVTLIDGCWIGEMGGDAITMENGIFGVIRDTTIADGSNNIRFYNEQSPSALDNVIARGVNGVYAENCMGVTVRGLFLGVNLPAVHLKNTHYSDIDGQFNGNAQESVLLENSNDNYVSGTYRSSSQLANVTYDHIRLTGTSSRNRISPKVMRAGDLANKARYCVTIGAGCADNDVSNGDMWFGAVVGYINDLGTRTTTTVPNRTGGAYRVLDTFSRTASSLGSPDIGPAWSVLFGSWSTDGVHANVSGVGSGSNAFNAAAVVDASAANATITGVMTAGNDAGILIRAVDASNYLLWTKNGVYARVADAFTAVSGASATTWANLSTFTIVASGTSLAFSVNGVPAFTLTTAQFQTATKFGIQGNTGTTWESFSVA